MAENFAAGIVFEPFGKTPDGQAVELYTLRNARGMQAAIATYGGIVTRLTAPDRHGHYEDVVLGYDTLAGYVEDSSYMGALIGRYANRIARGRFELDGVTYQLPINDGPNSLHGGRRGFHKALWRVHAAQSQDAGSRLVLTYTSRDGEEGYPGTLSVTATYTLTADDALRLDYSATTDKATVVNLTQHSYFNLRRHGDVLDHAVQIDADAFTPVDDTLIPTGELRAVEGTPFDFRSAAPLGERVHSHDEQFAFAGGFDHNWVSNRRAADPPVRAIVREPESGRVLEVLATAPGLQFYSGNFLDGSTLGKGGRPHQFRSAFCMEPQHFPDSPNQPRFPSTVLRPGQTYRSTMIYRFSV